MTTNTTTDELDRLAAEVTFSALADSGEIRQLEANGGRLEISEYTPRVVRIYDLSDGQMAYLIQTHDWLINTEEGPYVFKELADF
jgi:predicted ester cyclase